MLSKKGFVGKFTPVKVKMISISIANYISDAYL